MTARRRYANREEAQVLRARLCGGENIAELRDHGWGRAQCLQNALFFFFLFSFFGISSGARSHLRLRWRT